MSDRTQRMARMYSEEGMSYTQIAEHFGISRQRVHQLIGEHVEARPRATPAARIQELKAAHERVMRNESTLEEEAQRLGYASAASLRGAMHKRGLSFAGREVPSRRVVAPHGTIQRYRQTCRCDECRAANTRYHQERRRSGEPPRHGTDSGYRNYGCRCVPCTRATAIAQRERRAHARRQRPRRGSTATERRITS